MKNTSKILVIDDDRQVREALTTFLKRRGYTVTMAADGKAGLALVKTMVPDLVISDIMMPEMDGFELLQKIKEQDPDCPVILITGYSSVPGAIKAIRFGAEEYLVKPLDHQDVLQTVERTLKNKALRIENDRLKQRLADVKSSRLIGDSEAMQNVRKAIHATGRSEISVLIVGESGTGKELIAEAIHADGDRAHEPFIAINCAAIPNDLLESELFGHEKGAFSGASARKYGLFEIAASGTLFLDEIGEMSLPLQAKILRAIESRKIRRIGSTREIETNFRLICSTNTDLEKAMAAGTFRADLYYRISSYVITVPPLRERQADIPALAEHFAARWMNSTPTWDQKFIAALQNYSWPGNIRELKNVMERCSLLGDGQQLRYQDLPDNIRRWESAAGSVAPVPQPSPGGETSAGDSNLTAAGNAQTLSLADLERQHILKVIQACDNNKSRAARVLGISLKTLYNKLHRYAIKPTDV